VVMK